MITFRALAHAEVDLVWTIDRREVVDAVYVMRDGALALEPAYFDMAGWPPGEPELYSPILRACFARGGWFCGAFEDGTLIGVAVLDSRFMGAQRDQLQLKFLHVSRDRRGQGLGRRLFDLAHSEARRRGARFLYISATPSRRTIDFYLRLGATVAAAPDPELFQLEPEDIHLVYSVQAGA